MKILVSEKLSEHKYKTPEGYLICTDAILARTGKQQYTKDEVFGNGDNAEIDIDRPYNEVMNDKTITSFENKPVTFDHPNEDVNVGNYKDYSVGYVRDVRHGKADGQDVILGNLVITDQNAIDAIENGEHTQLSCGYDCDIKDDGKGNYFQSNIRGNHVALCKEGRAGNARIVDSIIKDSYVLVRAGIDVTDDDIYIAKYRFGLITKEESYRVINGIRCETYKISGNKDTIEKWIKKQKIAANFIKIYDSSILDNSFNYCKNIIKNSVSNSKGERRMKFRDEDRQLEVYKLCKANNWYTLGDTEDYEYMLNNADIWPVEKIAMNIANHSKQGFNEILTKLKIKLKDSNIRDTWSGTRNGIIYSYEDGFYYITHRNGKVERFPSDTFSNINELYEYVDKINDSVDDMAQKVFKFSTNIPALKRAIANNDKEEVKSMLTTLQKDKNDFEEWDFKGEMSEFDRKTFKKTMSEVMPGIKKMGLTLDSKQMTFDDALKILSIVKKISK